MLQALTEALEQRPAQSRGRRGGVPGQRGLCEWGGRPAYLSHGRRGPCPPKVLPRALLGPGLSRDESTRQIKRKSSEWSEQTPRPAKTQTDQSQSTVNLADLSVTSPALPTKKKKSEGFLNSNMTYLILVLHGDPVSGTRIKLNCIQQN